MLLFFIIWCPPADETLFIMQGRARWGPMAADDVWAVASCCQPALTRSPQRLCQGPVVYSKDYHWRFFHNICGGNHSQKYTVTHLKTRETKDTRKVWRIVFHLWDITAAKAKWYCSFNKQSFLQWRGKSRDSFLLCISMVVNKATFIFNTDEK